MNFSRPFFEWLALYLKDKKPMTNRYVSMAYKNGQLRQWNNMVLELSNRLLQTNPCFNEEKFLKACNYEND